MFLKTTDSTGADEPWVLHNEFRLAASCRRDWGLHPHARASGGLGVPPLRARTNLTQMRMSSKTGGGGVAGCATKYSATPPSNCAFVAAASFAVPERRTSGAGATDASPPRNQW